MHSPTFCPLQQRSICMQECNFLRIDTFTFKIDYSMTHRIFASVEHPHRNVHPQNADADVEKKYKKLFKNAKE